ncbi:MAG: aconitase/3-isopropylmalate dehydratase large subunit family protein [Chloroflexi bacterium]|nr:aconitase/3-isopropylmalate dehydratase large subunit family protein [Chloroflexota bacterium]
MGQTMAEKFLSRKNVAGKPVRAGDIIDARVDGIMLHASSGEVDHRAMQGGFSNGVPRVFDKDKVYVILDHYQPPCDHHYAKKNKAGRDMALRLGLTHFHDAGPGIAHQMMCELGYVRPGELVPGNDSHTVLYGALNVASSGQGEAELVHAVVFGEFWYQVPPTIKIVMDGQLPPYPFAKDIMLYLAGQYGDDFAQYRSVEYTGPVAGQMSIAGRMCMSCHTVEIGGKFGLFRADEKTIEFVKARTNLPFEPVEADPDAEYERVIEVNVDEIEPQVAKPHRFGNAVPVGEAAGVKINQAIIGACSNGRFEDIEIAHRILKGRRVARGVRFLISPASNEVLKECIAAGIIPDLLDAGVYFLDPGCGVCQPNRAYMVDGEVCITAATRNFRGRYGPPDSSVYLGGPATVAAAAVAGEITDPREVLRGR